MGMAPSRLRLVCWLVLFVLCPLSLVLSLISPGAWYSDEVAGPEPNWGRVAGEFSVFDYVIFLRFDNVLDSFFSAGYDKWSGLGWQWYHRLPRVLDHDGQVSDFRQFFWINGIFFSLVFSWLLTSPGKWRIRTARKRSGRLSGSSIRMAMGSSRLRSFVMWVASLDSDF